jgi:hypothetical protein
VALIAAWDRVELGKPEIQRWKVVSNLNSEEIVIREPIAHSQWQGERHAKGLTDLYP